MRSVLVLSALLGAIAASAAVSPSPLAGALEKAAAGLKTGGFVAAEIDGAEVRFLAAGSAAPRAGLAPECTLLEIGSLTKVFTSLLLAQTVHEGKAALGDPIAKFLPPDLALDPRAAAITLEQLASHTSGLPRLPDNLQPARADDPYADYDEARLLAFLRSYHPETNPPQPFAYSNLGAGLLGYLLERIHGKSYEELLREKITGPLGLADTVITLNDEQRTRLAVPHSGSQAVSPWRLNVLAGAGGLHSTAADLAKFAQALLAPDSPVAAAAALVREPHATVNGQDRIGLALFIGQRDGGTFYNHSGGTGGFRSHLELVPATRRATVILLNNDAPEPAIVLAAARAASAAATAATEREEIPLGDVQLADYAGVYRLEGRGAFTALVDAAGRLRIRLTGQAFLPAYHAGHDRFFLKAVAADYQFARDAAGRVVSVTLHQNGRQLPARRTADPVPVVIFLPEEKLRDYAGTYRLTPQMVFEIAPRGAQLYAKLTGQPALPVFADRADHFVYDVVEAALTFERDTSGAVTAVILHQNGRDQRAPRQP